MINQDRLFLFSGPFGGSLRDSNIGIIDCNPKSRISIILRYLKFVIPQFY